MRKSPIAPVLVPALLLGCLPLFFACAEGSGDGHGEHAHAHELTVSTVLDGLQNPSGISFSVDGYLTVCDAGPGLEHGNGRVQRWKDGETSEYLSGFATEFWKPGKDGAPDRFKLGPLSALYLADGHLAVTNAGLLDGADNLLFFKGPGSASEGSATNGIAPTTDDPVDKGEGNPTGMCLSANGKTIYVCGQGADAKTWVLACDVDTQVLSTFASADEHGIAINSPMDSLLWDAETLLVLYSGAGGKPDGLLVAWDLATRKPKAQWNLPGLADPMGMARVPGKDQLAIVDNNWSLTEVLAGHLGLVSLPEGGGDAGVELLEVELHGPVSCAFGPDGKLYVAQLGKSFDADQGSVVAIDGIH